MDVVVLGLRLTFWPPEEKRTVFCPCSKKKNSHQGLDRIPGRVPNGDIIEPLRVEEICGFGDRGILLGPDRDHFASNGRELGAFTLYCPFFLLFFPQPLLSDLQWENGLLFSFIKTTN